MMKRNRATHLFVSLIVYSAISTAWVTKAFAAEADQAVLLSREYLTSADPATKAGLAEKLAALGADWKPVVDQLRQTHHEAVKPGYYRAEHFTEPALRKLHPEDLLYIVVPTSYQPDKANALVVFMHGGGKGSTRSAP